MSAATKTRRWRVAVAILQDLQKSHLEPSEVTCSASLGACTWPEAVNLLTHFAINHLKINAILGFDKYVGGEYSDSVTLPHSPTRYTTFCFGNSSDVLLTDPLFHFETETLAGSWPLLAHTKPLLSSSSDIRIGYSTALSSCEVACQRIHWISDEGGAPDTKIDFPDWTKSDFNTENISLFHDSSRHTLRFKTLPMIAPLSLMVRSHLPWVSWNQPPTRVCPKSVQTTSTNQISSNLFKNRMFQWYLELLTLKHETGPILIPSPPWFQDWRWGTQLFQEIQLRRQLPTLISYNALISAVGVQLALDLLEELQGETDDLGTWCGMMWLKFGMEDVGCTVAISIWYINVYYGI